jgi:N-acetyl-gamma-glutamyl-phosphate reductase
MIRVGIIGGAGYTAGELIRILLNHPNVKITFVNSSSHDGKPVYDVHKDLIGETDLIFEKADLFNADVIFLCSGHGKSREFIANNQIGSHIKIIDLSNDFRLKDTSNEFIYGLPELNKESISKAMKIANPGCFATAIELAIMPLAANNLLNDDVHVNAITGSTGAGQELTQTSHFSWRNNNISIYKPFKHQHLAEIIQSIKQLSPNYSHNINFIPVRGNFTRGIFVSAYTKCALSLIEVKKIYTEYYHNHPFVTITDQNPDLKQVVNTNKCILYIEKHDDIVLIISIIDNLIKGASGQAIQNMNLMMGIDEKTGLSLKAVYF